MGCGQSKINIYPRKNKGKNSAKKSVSGDKPEGEEEDGADERDANENGGDGSDNDDCDSKKKAVKAKPVHVGGPLLAQAELSNSQQNFFKMLDDKIENGPDYDSNDETEIALETARLHSLLKDWETASSSSRSLPSTPRHNPRSHAHSDRSAHSAPKPHSRIPQNVIHQQYGVSPAPGPYRQPPQTYVPAYQNYGPYQEYSQPYAPHQNYSIPRQYSTTQHIQQHTTTSIQHQNVPNIVNQIPNLSNAVAVPGMAYQPTNSPKQHHKYPQIPVASLPAATLNYQTASVAMGSSPSHKIYVAPSQSQLQSQIQSQMQSQTASPSQNMQNYTNGELLIQQQLYNQQMQYQQSREYQQYRLNREQLLVQQQICATQGAYGVIPPQQTRGSHYQSSVHVPIVAVLPQGDQSPKMMQRKQPRQYSQEMT